MEQLSSVPGSSPDPSRVTTLRTHAAAGVTDREYARALQLQPGRIELSIIEGTPPVVAWTV